MGLTKEQLILLKEQIETSKERIQEFKEKINEEENNIKKLYLTLEENCDHVVVVSGIEGYYIDEQVVYHTCVKCGLTTKSLLNGKNYNSVSSLYGYQTKVHLEEKNAQEQYKKYLEEKPDIQDEELVRKFVKDYKGEEASKELVLKRQKTDYERF